MYDQRYNILSVSWLLPGEILLLISLSVHPSIHPFIHPPLAVLIIHFRMDGCESGILESQYILCTVMMIHVSIWMAPFLNTDSQCLTGTAAWSSMCALLQHVSDATKEGDEISLWDSGGHGESLPAYLTCFCMLGKSPPIFKAVWSFPTWLKVSCP